MWEKTDCGKQSAEEQLMWAPSFPERDLLNLLLFGIGKIIYPQHVVSLPRVFHNSMMWHVGSFGLRPQRLRHAQITNTVPTIFCAEHFLSLPPRRARAEFPYAKMGARSRVRSPLFTSSTAPPHPHPPPPSCLLARISIPSRKQWGKVQHSWI